MDSIGVSISPYIPGLTVEQKNQRLKIIEWGGFLALYYINSNAAIKPVKDFCENTSILNQFKGKDLKACISAIRIHLSKIRENKEIFPDKSLPVINLPAENISERKKISGKLRAKGMIVNKSNINFPEYFFSITISIKKMFDKCSRFAENFS